VQIQITLYGLLREKLPLQARGKTTLDAPDGTTLSRILELLSIGNPVTCAINGDIERDLTRLLHDGDQINIFRAAGGG
jgi:sulfur carrier protein ThiS